MQYVVQLMIHNVVSPVLIMCHCLHLHDFKYQSNPPPHYRINEQIVVDIDSIQILY